MHVDIASMLGWNLWVDPVDGPDEHGHLDIWAFLALLQHQSTLSVVVQ